MDPRNPIDPCFNDPPDPPPDRVGGDKDPLSKGVGSSLPPSSEGSRPSDS